MTNKLQTDCFVPRNDDSVGNLKLQTSNLKLKI